MTDVTRRDFLWAGGAAAAGFGSLLPAPAKAKPPKYRITIVLTGGPAGLDTFDPKPDAPVEVRGPFRPIRTTAPGVLVTELFPRIAKMMHRLTLVRTLRHDGPPLHEVGERRLLNEAGPAVRLTDGKFGIRCRRAVQMIEAGETASVVIPMFGGVENRLSWDCHAEPARFPVTLADYRDRLAPVFDLAFARLLRDLRDRGLWDETRVFAAGEIGRSPYLNAAGGRDHWTRCWSGLVAGGGAAEGRVVGKTDRLGGEVDSVR